MKNKIVISLSMALLLSFPLTSEARGGWNGIVTQIKDPKAMEAYAKEIQQLVELYEQGKKMQTQIEQLQQSLEHYKFTDLQQTYNFLADTVESAEKIQKDYVGMNITVKKSFVAWQYIIAYYKQKHRSAVQTLRCVKFNYYFLGASITSQPMYGRRASGTTTLPSAC